MSYYDRSVLRAFPKGEGMSDDHAPTTSDPVRMFDEPAKVSPTAAEIMEAVDACLAAREAYVKWSYDDRGVYEYPGESSEIAPRAALEAKVNELIADNNAIRTLVNAYNLGGWTDAVAPMKRALAAEAALAKATADLDNATVQIHELQRVKDELAEAQKDAEQLRQKLLLFTTGQATEAREKR